MSKYSDNLNKALKKIEQAQSYIQDIEAAGFTLPDYYKTIPKELEDIKNNPNRQGISDERLNHIRYLFNGNTIKSRARIDTTYSDAKADEGKDKESYRINVETKLGTVRVAPLGKDIFKYNELNKFGRAIQEALTTIEYEMGVVPNSAVYSNMELLDKTLEEVNTKLGTNYDITQLSALNRDINEYNRNIVGTGLEPIDPNTFDAILRYATNAIAKAPIGATPYREQIEKGMGDEGTLRALGIYKVNGEDKGFGWSDDEIRNFISFVDTSVFWKQVHKENFESSATRHDIKAFATDIKDLIISGNSKNINELRRKLRNGTPYKDIDKWLQTL